MLLEYKSHTTILTFFKFIWGTHNLYVYININIYIYVCVHVYGLNWHRQSRKTMILHHWLISEYCSVYCECVVNLGSALSVVFEADILVNVSTGGGWLHSKLSFGFSLLPDILPLQTSLICTTLNSGPLFSTFRQDSFKPCWVHNDCIQIMLTHIFVASSWQCNGSSGSSLLTVQHVLWDATELALTPLH